MKAASPVPVIVLAIHKSQKLRAPAVKRHAAVHIDKPIVIRFIGWYF